MALLDMVAELTGILPGLSPELALTHINRAYAEVLSARNWSFLVSDGVVVCPTQITSGAMSYTQYDTTVTCDATASAALLAQATPGAVPGLTTMQLRLNPSGASPAVSQVYSIIEADITNPAAIVLTVDRIIVESTSATAAYQVYRCYVVPPYSDFKAWKSFVDMTNGWALKRDFDAAGFDVKDPQRQAQGQAYYLGSFVGNKINDPITGTTTPNPNQNAGTPVYELWPHPTSGQTFYVRIRRNGVPLSADTDEVPDQISEALVIQRALGWHSYQFAQANVAHYPEFKGVQWTQLVAQARSYYKDELLDAKRNDDEQSLQTVFNRGHGLRSGSGGGKGMSDFPIDAAFMQSHLLLL